ncbi:hypothetical protein [Mycoplasma sp. SG1]|uniref:hypothetical protein n=1 Tax=Mycoplasma sp. SG1 TaxID=2810348 RepID=UPI002025A95F|nr:hypothetical protein [Mycoplasma sp. SG1]URM52943.1 hypothetical protein JRW51_01180 [Mycoplasma sp. SG1]
MKTKKSIFKLTLFIPILSALFAGCGVSDNFNWSKEQINQFIKENYQNLENNLDFKQKIFAQSNAFEYEALDNHSIYANNLCSPANLLNLSESYYLGKYTNVGNISNDTFFKVLVIYQNLTTGGDIMLISYIDQQTQEVNISKTFLYDMGSFFKFPQSLSKGSTLPEINNYITKFSTDRIRRNYKGAKVNTDTAGENIKFFNILNDGFDFKNSDSIENIGIKINKMNTILEFSVNFSYEDYAHTAQFETLVNIDNKGIHFNYEDQDKKVLLINKINYFFR